MKTVYKWFLSAVIIFGTTGAFSQGILIGSVADSQTGDPLPAASVVIKGAISTGTTTDFDGNFRLNVGQNEGNLVISYIGFQKKTVTFSINSGETKPLGRILLAPNTEELEGVVLVGAGIIDLARDRQTPIAVSTIGAAEIREKIGTKDITETLVNTPSVYVAGQSGGFGDSRISVRGFDDTNTAFLLNGQPINGMEDGRMFWSNWSGMADITNGIQVQRGLGSSKLAISSVGGTVNFVIRATDKKQGGFASASIANDSYFKTTVGYSTGISEKGWGVSAMVTHWQGDGYNEGNFGQGQVYFFSVGYQINEDHNFNFLITGAPQYHDQNFTKPISSYLEYGRKYNTNWGTLNGEYLTERRNYYHKPVANLNWDWEINETSQLSTVLYASWGRGGGTGDRGNRVRTAEGRVDFDAISANNAAIPDGIGSFGNDAYIIRASVNNHNWYGLVSNFNQKLSENIEFNFGADFRTYKGTHYRQAINFLGLDGWTESRDILGANHQPVQEDVPVFINESLKPSPWNATFNTLGKNQRIQWDYTEGITYIGAFTQLEYATDNFSTFFQGSISEQFHVRQDRYQYERENEQSDRVNNFGYNVKAGANYKLDTQNSLYVNAGYYSRQPFQDNIYLNFTNAVNPLTVNEKILGLEAGYSFRSAFLNANLNLYRTAWKDRVTTESNIDNDTGDLEFFTNQGVEQLHMGAELDVIAKPLPNLDIKGFVSVGNWEYVDDIVTVTRDEQQTVLSVNSIDVDGGKVGDAAQFTVGLGFEYGIIENLSLDADWRLYNNLYANRTLKDNLKLPSFNVLDMGVSYSLPLGDIDTKNLLNFRVNINNVLHEIYISESTTAIKADDFIDADNPALGTYANNNRLYKGIADANNVYFGWGRTWSFSVRYTF